MLDPLDIKRRIESFKEDLSLLTPIDVVRKHVINGGCPVITDSAYFELRSTIARKYALHPNEILVVGSGKLGFSIAPSKRYRHFCDTSDIDLVIVSEALFDRFWEAVHRFWYSGGYWERQGQFQNYLFQGWIRPDKLPPANTFRLANDWWKFFNSVSSGGKYSMYKIAGALYKNWYFLEAYQLRGVNGCIEELRAQGGN